MDINVPPMLILSVVKLIYLRVGRSSKDFRIWETQSSRGLSDFLSCFNLTKPQPFLTFPRSEFSQNYGSFNGTEN